MQLRVVDGSESKLRRQRSLISYVVAEKVAFDAGALALMPLEHQKQLTSIFLSHSHADHIATLPLLIDNVYRPGPDCITLYANQSTIRDLKAFVFNDHIWPDVFRLSEQASPFIEFKVIEPGEQISLHGLRVTAFEVNHTIPTLGFLVENDRTAIAIVADTGPCQSIWDFLSDVETLQAVFLEISFPNSMQWLADVAKHLTPSDFIAETRKLRRAVDWYITHVKPEYGEVIAREVQQLEIRNCNFAMGSELYHF